ncbi:Phospholipase D [Komagataella phaffii CBS 7435]|uniref:Phospholipase n=2 Tax=Komagataella phaffii TaxID=460519 RepID=C4R558_KOMPG|nr:Phospholipase D, catalyzes the hydrolysis of phosphatidylcholine [Komagataella phaffii GS115]AOA63902.1 GQ67_03732T0 [Komagataella phaffii]CAH2449530.1 Phospholipase D [Komagataella phaffii CBS 7435]AOA68477.1 GQ68_03704T0 [Komagataella phaffii GS115]CAY70694.1 Phospholipase D, catalyzes the hydrolysis of phosphatidylcholine [Komagataella phaffii GS115]CCA39512.1 Phospholipase D [Komagataella phaffii CBS 7435]
MLKDVSESNDSETQRSNQQENKKYESKRKKSSNIGQLPAIITNPLSNIFLEQSEDTGVAEERAGNDEGNEISHKEKPHQEFYDNESKQNGRKTRPPSKKPKPSSKGEENDENLDNNWIQKFKHVRTPTHLSFNDQLIWKELKRPFKRDKSAKVLPKRQQNDRGDGFRQEEEEEEEENRDTRIRAKAIIDSLALGSPSVLLAASVFLRDEHGTRRAPLLLGLLGFKLVDVTKYTVKSDEPLSKNRTYRFDLEYGVGPTRHKWSVTKSIKDIAALHSRLKVSFFQENALRGTKDVELPKFPKISNYIQKFKQTQYQRKKDERQHSRGNSPSPRRASHSVDQQDVTSVNSLSSLRTNSSARELFNNFVTRMSSAVHQTDQRSFPLDLSYTSVFEEYREALDDYLKELLIVLTLRPQSNKLFQFFELSPIGELLVNDSGFHGKQGYLRVSSSARTQGWRVGHLKVKEWKAMVERHTAKWFLIKESYIMYVADIYSTTPLEVFLVDSSFKYSFSGDQHHHKLMGPVTDTLEDSDFDDVSLQEFTTQKNQRDIAPRLAISVENGERKIKMIAQSERQMKLWIQSIVMMEKNSKWAEKHRFDSFAPVRKDCYAQWFVDGRDYMWAASSAIEMAKDVIYIHDWWLSPELYLRRPANGNQQWRIDRLLLKKAEEGVKIFIIIYRNVGTFVVTDSLWTKHSFLSLHPNIYVLRSPNQLLQNTYFWAHHEKLLIVDQTICFLGGIDLCYGRFDTPDHTLTDANEKAFEDGSETYDKDPLSYQMFPGKDYSNPRVKDFYALEKPYDDMYNREEVPRMPWHDVHMASSGQIARDLSRHFVQRWNYLLRQKRPSRSTPLLLPPADLTPEQLESSRFKGTCEIQLLRSSCNWSLGLKQHEQSIQNAYLKLIETSNHFIYIENQFFITSSAWQGVVIENTIGDAIVDRIIRARNENKTWKAIIVIPLLPGFEAKVDEPGASSLRVIVTCQYMSISVGPTSIFGKLRKLGIDPEEYIQFYSLRKWACIGKKRRLVTEQLYVHAKTMIVDDRSVIIGSANINERSMTGTRDSEVASIIRDREMIQTTMNGEPYLAAKFAHTLRMRLMREHLGVDVDILDMIERRFNDIEKLARTSLGKKAATGKFKNEEHEVMSAMVELATRDVLGKKDGTKRWSSYFSTIKSMNGNSDLPSKLHDALERIIQGDQIDTDSESESESYVTELPHPIRRSFNNRAGHENAGLRDAKSYSTDPRIHHNDSHKKDIKGKGQDRYDSPGNKKSRKRITQVLQDWALKATSELPYSDDVFVPNHEQVMQFLNSKDHDPESEGGEETNNWKNIERWGLLKRVAYLQRLMAKQQKDKAAEREKREALNSRSKKQGVSPASSLDQNQNTAPNGSAQTDKVKVSGVDSAVELGEHLNEKGRTDGNVAPGLNHSGSLGSDEISNVKVIHLEPSEVKDIIESLETRGISKPRFIDPYAFEDPLDDDFYEDLWHDTAFRNTAIFRMVFHCQPDDDVLTWNDYKNFSKLDTAFNLAQKKRENGLTRVDSSSEDPNNSQDTSISITDIENATSYQRDKVLQSEEDAEKPKRQPLHGKLKKSVAGGGRKMSYSSEHSQDSIVGDSSDQEQPSEDSTIERIDTEIDGALDINTEKSRKTTTRRRRLYPSRRVVRNIRNSVFDWSTAELLLSYVRGNLVLFPVEWLMAEIESGNLFYRTDRLPPIEIYD